MSDKTCVVCGRAFSSNGHNSLYCSGECHRARQSGAPDRARTQILMANVEMIPFSGCWIWLGRLTRKGYGELRMFGRTQLAHRVSYCAHHGIPLTSIEGFLIRHRCDVPMCINPAHLEPGSSLDNSNDMVARNRSCVGSKNSASRLTDEQVLSIRSTHVPHDKERGSSALAKKYGVSTSAISLIVTGKNWRHLS